MYRKFAPGSDLNTYLTKHPRRSPLSRIESVRLHKRRNTMARFPRGFGDAQLQKSVFDYIHKHPEKIELSDNARNSRIVLQKVLEKESASDTIQVLAKMNKEINGVQGIFFKIYFARDKSTGDRDDSLEVENRLYKDVTNKLLFNEMTPHLIAFYGTVKVATVGEVEKHLLEDCAMNNYASKDEELTYENQTRRRYKQGECANAILFRRYIEDFMTDHALKGRFNLHQMNMMCLERSRGKPLSKYKRDNVLVDEQVWVHILFQVVWTLLCFGQAGLIHNDLHDGNIFLTILNSKQRYRDVLYFISRNEIYNLRDSPVFVQIYDFDRGAKVPIPGSTWFADPIYNGRLSAYDCKPFNNCNRYDSKIDITRLLYYIVEDFGKHQACINVVSQIADVNYLRTLTPKDPKKYVINVGDYVWDGNACRATQVEPVQVDANGKIVRQQALDCRYYKPTDSQVLPLYAMLQKLAQLGNLQYRQSKYLAELKADESDKLQVYALPLSQQNNEKSLSRISYKENLS